MFPPDWRCVGRKNGARSITRARDERSWCEYECECEYEMFDEPTESELEVCVRARAMLTIRASCNYRR